jgi:hypothetical protein
MNSINDNFYKDFSIFYHFSFIFLFCFSFYLILKTKKGPGIIDKNSKGPLTTDISFTNNNETKNISLSSSSLFITKSDLVINENCDICNITNLPLRSHHCKRCGTCALTYDHHCKFINICIGENNHIIFIFFLFFQTTSIVVALYGLFKTINVFLEKNEKSKYSDIPLPIFFFIFILLFFFGYCGILFLFHCYLICTNQTTYEIFYTEKCPYLSIFKAERNKILNERGIEVKPTYAYHPFDSGIINNVKLFVNKMFNNKNRINWEEKYFENLKTNNIYKNFCDNEYWSCF